MTRPGQVASIDNHATLQQGLRDLQQNQRERILRELRYTPGFTGNMTFTIKFKNGIPFALTEAIEHNTLIRAVSE